MTMTATDDVRIKRIARLNDQLRTTMDPHLGCTMMTPGVSERGPEFLAGLLRAVRNFSAFTEDNDPHGEHDCASIEFAGDRWLFKIDYYARGSDYSYGSDDPSDPAKTSRVLTIMLASEY